MAVARDCGMLHQRVDTRATFVIDPQGMIRAITRYAMNVGRCVDELVRLLAALQTSDRARFSRRKEPCPWLRRGAAGDRSGCRAAPTRYRKCLSSLAIVLSLTKEEDISSRWVLTRIGGGDVVSAALRAWRLGITVHQAV
jgi:hypothetical protein